MRALFQHFNWVAFLLLSAFFLLQPQITASETESKPYTSDEETWFGEKHPMLLKRGELILLRYPLLPLNSTTSPKAVVIFGSGCGGWSDFEKKVSRRLQKDGCTVFGIDFAQYAKADYDLETLQYDYKLIIRYALRLTPNPEKRRLPIIIGGWSTGAEQAVAIAAGPQPPSGLSGLLLIAPGSEGAYGMYAVNYFNITTPAAKLFKLAEMGPRISNLPVAQWHATYDPLDSCAWLSSLKTPHREFDFRNAVHDYGSACDEFLDQLNGTLDWILSQDASASSAPAFD